MDKALEELSASALRNLLIVEVKIFIYYLEQGPIPELTQMKDRLRKIYELIAEKEREEEKAITWGKNTTQPVKNSPPESIDKIISDLQSD
jgi:hypothetical protein